MKRPYRTTLKAAAAAVLMLTAVSCHYKYSSNVLDLAFYQWNQWADEDGTWREEVPGDSDDVESGFTPHTPTCGWEDLHRGMGNLVRIPAVLEDYRGVSWYHTRFTLPDLWEGKSVAFRIDSTGPETEVYLNTRLVGTHQGLLDTFEIDVTGIIYYQRDNHLAIRITDPFGGGGIKGNVSLVAGEEEVEEPGEATPL